MQQLRNCYILTCPYPPAFIIRNCHISSVIFLYFLQLVWFNFYKILKDSFFLQIYIKKNRISVLSFLQKIYIFPNFFDSKFIFLLRWRF
uniref:Uncharacterized protein n=1 Tax=Meloidogyne enterolobii TaxID=390850 RepID=A0A6V7UF23_MELEN|nr:unnamed protein product [Meloidogyne enterolobii]